MNYNYYVFDHIDYIFALGDQFFVQVGDYNPSYANMAANSLEQEDAAEKAEKLLNSPYSPIVVDLDGDGIETSRLTLVESGGIRFDLDGNGTTDRVGWLRGDDAFLVRDSDGDGVISSGLEMFGGGNRGEGFSELAALDNNEDGVLNFLDDNFSSLSLWRDANANGVTDAGEIKSLDSVGLMEIGLAYENWNASDHGNLLGERSSVTINGEDHMLVDVYFRADLDFVV